MNKKLLAAVVLMVEDSATDAELCIRTLKKQGLANNIVWVKDGAEALEYLFRTDSDDQARELPKLVLLDLHLPKVSGLEVLHKIKTNDRTKLVPVVILTSSKEDRDIIEGYNLGVNSYLSKPVAFEDFITTVTQMGLYWLVVNHSPLHEAGTPDDTQHAT
jgi:two-component system, response regulator